MFITCLDPESFVREGPNLIMSFFSLCGDRGSKYHYTRDVFYVRREVDLMKTAEVNAYIMYIFGKIELLSIRAT